ncbi:signal recognition particle-docking protein FtsY [Mixta intestinalis]|uniref:Signal recognition particle receptor FtsY n=1 Tax=Mixta intestinalis TaxID=1615494 RepID=A0A6P1Q5U3_9GAMM|nr:signal recognition particle-docking protein FtsY [Mixta intestinalis]QHM73429.1 Signal recognition particle receptor FtsY [Mixta intestinalis]
MAKEKKRGFFSWLGFGREETPAQPEEQKETLTEQTEAAAESDASTATPVSAGQLAEEIVATTEEVARQEEARSTPIEEEILPEESAPAEAVAPVEEEILPEEIAPAEAIAPVEEESESAKADEKDAVIAAEVAVAVALSDTHQPDAVLEEEAPLSDDELTALALAEEAPEEAVTPVAAPVEQERPTKEGFFARLKRSLVKTRQNLGSGFVSLFRGKKIDDELFEELEEQLLIADVGVETTQRIINSLTQQANRKQLRDAEALYGLLKAEMASILHQVDAPLEVDGKTPFVILMVGVNGVGKTTTIGKLARQYQAQGKSVMLAAGDTFRAAAVEQLQVWGERNHIPVVAQHTGADSASVIFDAIQAAKARGVDVLIADTAGRLQNKAHLMEELKKIVRVMKKLDENAPHEVMLTIDASTGQNAVSQTKLFHEAVGLTGITLTKLDGTAKGGVIFSVADQFSIPIRFIGVGEGIDDLRPFKAEDFIEALFARED